MFSATPRPADDVPAAANLPEFRRLGLVDELVAGVQAMGHEAPSPIQRAAVPQILKGDDLAIAGATGSGKTLSFLLPVVQAIKTAEWAEQAEAGDHESVFRERVTKRPRVLVLVPTRELASQVLSVAKQLSHFAKFSSCGVVGGDDYGKQKRGLAGAVDVVVASPGRLLKHRDQGHVFLSRVSHVVIDEVDTMLTQGFGPDIKELLAPILFNPDRKQQTQFVLATATMTKAVRRLLEEEFPGMRMLEAGDLHKSVPTVRHRMVDSKGRDKLQLLLSVLREVQGEGRVMVFANTVKSCQAAQHAMTEAGLECVGYHGEMPSPARLQSLQSFAEGDVTMLVATDLAARGLDIPDVRCVVNFDFPMNPIDYLHRTGRTGRFGKRGEVASLVAKRDLPLATAIERAIAKNEPLDGLTNVKRDYQPGGKLSARPGKPGGANGGRRSHTPRRGRAAGRAGGPDSDSRGRRGAGKHARGSGRRH